MTSFLLLLSFLLHLIFFIFLYRFYEQTKQEKESQAEQVEKLLQAFMKEIRLENERLERHIKEQNIETDKLSDETKQASTREKEGIENLTYQPMVRQTVNSPSKEASKERVKDVIETSFEAKVLQLAKAGLSIDDIAKKLNRGKTEVGLIIKLNE